MAQVPLYPLDVMHHQTSGRLDMLWSDGFLAQLSSVDLRRACRCATCVQQRRNSGVLTVPISTRLASVLAVGEMGLQLVFSDGHDRGIYPWPFLHELSLAQTTEAKYEQPV